jgi:hypothetical protein
MTQLGFYVEKTKNQEYWNVKNGVENRNWGLSNFKNSLNQNWTVFGMKKERVWNGGIGSLEKSGD